jgi:hypothetical protein
MSRALPECSCVSSAISEKGHFAHIPNTIAAVIVRCSRWPRRASSGHREMWQMATARGRQGFAENLRSVH